MGHTDNEGLAWILVTLVWSCLVCFNLVWFRLAWIDFVWSHFVRFGLVREILNSGLYCTAVAQRVSHESPPRY